MFVVEAVPYSDCSCACEGTFTTRTSLSSALCAASRSVSLVLLLFTEPRTSTSSDRLTADDRHDDDDVTYSAAAQAYMDCLAHVDMPLRINAVLHCNSCTLDVVIVIGQ